MKTAGKDRKEGKIYERQKNNEANRESSDLDFYGSRM